MIKQTMETSAASDSELLTAWVTHRRESAFHALVARYAPLVHMAAKRTSGDDALAADASQLVIRNHQWLDRQSRIIARRTDIYLQRAGL